MQRREVRLQWATFTGVVVVVAVFSTAPALACGVTAAVGTAATPVAQAEGPERAATLAEAGANYAETTRKCRLLQVAAVRAECLRRASETLQRERVHLDGSRANNTRVQPVAPADFCVQGFVAPADRTGYIILYPCGARRSRSCACFQTSRRLPRRW